MLINRFQTGLHRVTCIWFTYWNMFTLARQFHFQIQQNYSNVTPLMKHSSQFICIHVPRSTHNYTVTIWLWNTSCVFLNFWRLGNKEETCTPCHPRSLLSVFKLLLWSLQKIKWLAGLMNQLTPVHLNHRLVPSPRNM